MKDPISVTNDLFACLERVTWLSTIGTKQTPQVEFFVTYLNTKEEALTSFKSNLWVDAKTEAQGDLTGYLAKHHYNSYGGHWNELAKQSRVLVEKASAGRLRVALHEQNLSVELLQPILVDLNRAVLEFVYRRAFPQAPVFFGRLLRLYQAGRLPCGWNGAMSDWPSGNVMAY